MSDPEKHTIGSIGWRDLTAEHAAELADFYRQVAGWQSEPVSQGEYDDFVMKDADGTAVAGICHARGANAELPPQWLIYVTVEDLEGSIQRCEALGGKTIAPVREMGSYGTMSVIQDPAGAVVALIQPQSDRRDR